MKKKYAAVMVPNITAMITGVYLYHITPRKITLVHTDGTRETVKGKHPFHCFAEGEEITDENFNAFKTVTYVQSQRGAQ